MSLGDASWNTSSNEVEVVVMDRDNPQQRDAAVLDGGRTGLWYSVWTW